MLLCCSYILTVYVHVAVLVFLHIDSVCYGPCGCGVVLTFYSVCYGPCDCVVVLAYWQCESWSMLLCCCYILTVFAMVPVAVLLLHIDSVCHGPCCCFVLTY